MAALIGRKVGMTQTFGDGGERMTVTVVQGGPCKVIGLRNVEKDGYQAAILGYEQIEGGKVKKKPLLGFFKKAGSPAFRHLKEFRDFQTVSGADLSVGQFQAGDVLRVSGTTKGHGWTSHIKKWNHQRGRMSHGGNFPRAHGGTSCNTWPARVLKGKKMSGVWGSETKTLRTVEVVGIDSEQNLIMLKGCLPGGRRSLLTMERLVKAQDRKKKVVAEAS